jgi:hypothetical protein
MEPKRFFQSNLIEGYDLLLLWFRGVRANGYSTLDTYLGVFISLAFFEKTDFLD